MKSLTIGLITIFFVILEGVGCALHNGKINGGNDMTSRPAADTFVGIEHGDGNPNACTPEIGDDFIGIKINTPVKVAWSAADRDPVTDSFTRVMLCGTYRLPAADIVDTEGFYLSASLAATNVQTHHNCISLFQTDSHQIENPDPPRFTTEELEGLYETGYFNINILEVLDLPEETGEYLVFVTFKSFKSNVQRIVLEHVK